VSAIGEIGGAFYLGVERFVFVDVMAQQLVFVDFVSGAVESAGGEGDGPQEFRSAELLSRTERGGVVVWDAERRRTSVVDVVDGSWLVSDDPRRRRFNQPSMADLGTRPVARYWNGTSVIQTNAAPSGNPFDQGARNPGSFRDTLQFWLVVPEEDPRLMFEAMSSERYSSVLPNGNRSTLDLIFGHLLLQAQVGQHLAVAQTDLGSVRVFDHSGNVRSDVPLPPRVSVSAAQIQAERNHRLAAIEAEAIRMTDGSTGRFDFGRLWRARADHIQMVPGNEAAPPIDRLKGDLDGRLWMRLVRPGDEREHWQVWELAGPELAFTLTLSEGEALLDATGDRVLVTTTGEFDEAHLLVKEMAR